MDSGWAGASSREREAEDRVAVLSSSTVASASGEAGAGGMLGKALSVEDVGPKVPEWKLRRR